MRLVSLVHVRAAGKWTGGGGGEGGRGQGEREGVGQGRTSIRAPGDSKVHDAWPAEGDIWWPVLGC